jgi:hypothetical protein
MSDVAASIAGLRFLSWACHGITVFREHHGCRPTLIEVRLTPLSLPQIVAEAPHLLVPHKLLGVDVRLSEIPAECGDIEIVLTDDTGRRHTRQAGLDRILS